MSEIQLTLVLSDCFFNCKFIVFLSIFINQQAIEFNVGSMLYMSAEASLSYELTQAELRYSPGWNAPLTLQMLDLIIKLHLSDAASMQGQSCRPMPTIEPTLPVCYGH